jgi:hypothetical protein
MQNNENKKSNLEIVDDVYHDAAMSEVGQRKRTPEQVRWASGVAIAFQNRIAEMRRSRLPATVTPLKAKPIRPSLLAMGRDALLAKLTELMRAPGLRIQYAHRNLTGLTDDDLRRMLDLLEPSDPTE